MFTNIKNRDHIYSVSRAFLELLYFWEDTCILFIIERYLHRLRSPPALFIFLLYDAGSSLQSCSESHCFKALLWLIRLFLLLLTLQSSVSLWSNYSFLHFLRYHDVRRTKLSVSVISPPWPSFRCRHQLLRLRRNVFWSRSLLLAHSMMPTFLTTIEFHFWEFMFYSNYM